MFAATQSAVWVLRFMLVAVTLWAMWRVHVTRHRDSNPWPHRFAMLMLGMYFTVLVVFLTQWRPVASGWIQPLLSAGIIGSIGGLTQLLKRADSRVQ